jgi:cytochrome c oxidase subunit IV
MASFEKGFIKRLCSATFIVGALVWLVLCEFQNWRLILSYSVGLLLGLLFVCVTCMFVTDLIFRQSYRRRLAVVLMVAKYVLLLSSLYLLTTYRAINYFGLLIGLSLPPFVLVLKLVGKSVVEGKRVVAEGVLEGGTDERC